MEGKEEEASWFAALIGRLAEPELRRTMRLLRMANDQLALVTRENIRLTDLCDEQNNTLASLQSDNRELKAHIQRLEQGNAHQVTVMATMERRMMDIESKYERLLGLYFQLQAQTGNPIGLSNGDKF